MILVRNLLGWIGRHFLLLILILGLLLLHQQLWPRISAELAAARSLPQQQQSYEEAASRFGEYRREREQALSDLPDRLRGLPREALQSRLRQIPTDRKAAEADLKSKGQLAMAAVAGDGTALFDHARAGAEIALLDREQGLIRALLQSRNLVPFCQEPLADCGQRLARNHDRLKQEELKLRARAQGLNDVPLSEARIALCRSGVAIGCARFEEARRLAAEAEELGKRTAFLRAQHAAVEARIQSEAAFEGGSRVLAERQAALAAAQGRLAEQARESWIGWALQPVLKLLPQALIILLLIIFSPLLIKALAYFVIAPLAAGRRRVHLLPGENCLASGSGSAVTRQVTIRPDQELLVLPEYLQASPDEAAKATQWLLDWTVPLSSLASGMVALTRIRTQAPASVAVSALKDPLSEIGIVTLEEGAAMVFRPRSLVGILKPAGSKVAITRHWRLGHLSAWLTFQLRFLIIHGPCDLIVQGSRGVRLEPAGDGRSINQAATLGYSAGLHYGVRRSETFGAYLLGKQGLFIDSFRGEGVYLYEEMPRAGKKSGLWGRGFEGISDAFLSLFGL